MIIQNVKGGYDFLPKQQKIRNYINGVLKETFENYGYKPIETPILCYFDMLAGKYDENNDILNEIYKLTDQGNRKLGLRYDLTVPFAKFIALNKNEIKLPFKRYEINKVFRDGPVKVGRDREFTQCDVDVVGLEDQMIEVELLSLYVKAFTKLNIEIIIKFNSRNLMKGLIKEVNVKEELNNKFKETSNEYIIKGLEELNNLNKYIKYLKLDEYCVFTSSLARGQDYYTGNVFEVYEKNGKLKGAIGGGGRYDKMITEFIDDGTVYPAVGISFGLTSIYELLKEDESLNKNSNIDIYIIPLNTKYESLELASKLRDYNINIDIEMEDKKIKKSLDYCNKEEIPYVIILGEDEINNKVFKLKDMNKKIEYEIKMDGLEKVQRIIKNLTFEK